MSGYVPTTEHVRMKYQDGVSGCGCCVWPDEEDAAQFNRWLAEVIREAKREARDEGFHSGVLAHQHALNGNNMEYRRREVNPHEKEQQ